MNGRNSGLLMNGSQHSKRLYQTIGCNTFTKQSRGYTVTLLAFCLLLAPIALGDRVLFIPLGDLEGGAFYSQPRAISDDGSTIVGGSESKNGVEAFWWRNGVMEPLSDLPGGNFESFAFGVNSDGTVVVGRGHSGDGSRTQACIWILGELQALSWPDSDFDDYSCANGVSSDGRIVTGFSTNSSSVQATMWVEGTPTLLGDFDGGGFDSASVGPCSADGAIMSGRGQTSTSNYYQACYWHDGELMALTLLGGANPETSETLGVSSDGRIIVGYSSSERSIHQRNRGEACLWVDGIPKGLGDLPGETFSSIAWATSDDGRIVVGSGNVGSNPAAFIWDEENGMRELRQVLLDSGVDVTKWKFDNAIAISADGHAIVGNGRNPSGDTEGFLVRFMVRGDMNCDRTVDFEDIDGFVVALFDHDGYSEAYPTCDYYNADCDANGFVDFNDIDPFVECLINGGCP